MSSILIIDNFDSFTFNLYQMLSMLAAKVIVKRNNELDLKGIEQLRPDGIVLSPGPGHPANERDFGICKQIIESAEEMDSVILGVCLGHQGIVQHSGGNVIRAQEPVHGKMSAINLVSECPLFKGLDSGIKVMRYHSLIAERSSLPANLEVVAELETADKTIMAVQNKSRKLFGVQFHPESVGTGVGSKILENYVSLC